MCTCSELHILKVLGSFNPNLGQIWTKPKMCWKNGFKLLTQWLSLSIFDPKMS